MPKLLQARRHAVPFLLTLGVVLVTPTATLAAPVPGVTTKDYNGYRLVDGHWTTSGSPILRVDANDTATPVFTTRSIDPAGSPTDEAFRDVPGARTQSLYPPLQTPLQVLPKQGPDPSVQAWPVPIQNGSQALLVAIPRSSSNGVSPIVTDGPDAASFLRARLVVRASSSITLPQAVSNRRRPFNVRGRLDGRAGDPTAARVHIQVVIHGRWRTLTTARPTPTGTWRTTIALTHASAGRVRLRASIPQVAGYPYATGRSPETNTRLSAAKR